MNQVRVRFPVRAQARVAGLIPSVGRARGSRSMILIIDVSLSPSPFLSEISKNLFKKYIYPQVRIKEKIHLVCLFLADGQLPHTCSSLVPGQVGGLTRTHLSSLYGKPPRAGRPCIAPVAGSICGRDSHDLCGGGVGCAEQSLCLQAPGGLTSPPAG
uniref:Uncharacterized protein n=1 Tax=Myotis myotis TaxID=51298 RepID=A0A7J7RUP0_MYOMY|nr:hypothetical protein mMyoMyo1_010157 [Myotis myotis]